METVQQKFIKRTLHFPFNTPKYFVRLETGQTHVRLKIFSLAVGMWLRALRAPEDTILKDAYLALKRAAANSHVPKYNWCLQLKEALREINMEYLW